MYPTPPCPVFVKSYTMLNIVEFDFELAKGMKGLLKFQQTKLSSDLGYYFSEPTAIFDPSWDP